MKQISLFIPLLGTLLLSGCAGTSTEFECNATTSDTCMTMEQANEKAKKLEQSSEAKPVAASLPRLAEGNFRTMPVQTVTATTPSGSRPAVTAHPEQKLLAPRPLFTAAREVKTVVPVSSVTPVTPPRPLRTGEQTAALWIAPYIDTRVLSDNESKVFFEKVKGQYPEMDIKIPFLTVMETLQYKPAESAAKVQCPVLVVIAGQDSVNPPEQGRALYDAVASGTKELYEEADACHYDIYEGAFFERVAAVQTQWFKKHL